MFHVYSDKPKVLITGGNGFLGGFVRRALIQKGYPIQLYSSSQYDLRDPEKCKQSILDCRPQIIIHLAATCGGIGANQDDPARFFYDNMMMGMNVLHQSWLLGLKKVVMVGTVCSYPSETPVPFKEEDIWNGYPEPTNAPYGIAKRALMEMASCYVRQYKQQYAYVIPANLYGPEDHFNLHTSHVIPAIITKIVKAKALGENEVWLWGDGSPTREFLYVQDAAEAIVGVMEQLGIKREACWPTNIGSGEEISIKALAEKIKAELKYTGNIIWEPSRPNGQMRRAIDSSRAFKLLEWRPKVNLDEGLKRTIAYYEKGIRNGDLWARR